jgi:two-component system sensor histidine kinase AgrC
MSELVSKLLSGMMMTISGTVVVSKLLDREININIKNIITLFLLSFSTVIFYKIKYDFSISILTFLLTIYSYRIIFNISTNKAIISSFLMMCLVIIAEVVLTIMAVIFKMDINTLRSSTNDIFILMNFSVCSIMLILIDIEMIKFKLRDLLQIINEQQKLVTFVLCAAEIIAVSMLLSKIEWQFKITYGLFMNIFLIISCLLIFYIFAIEKIKYRKLIDEYDHLVKYVKNIEDWVEQDKIKNHENKNQLIIIRDMVSKRNKKLIDYINNILNESIIDGGDWFVKLKNIPKGGLKGLIYYKIMQAKNDNIELSLDISKELKKNDFLNIDTSNYKKLCTILGVYLDNAIEASKKCNNKQIGIEIYKEKDVIKIVISNTYCDRLDINKLDKGGYSTKGNGRGYGLALVKTLIDKNDIISQHREIKKDYFIQYLNIKISKDINI